MQGILPNENIDIHWLCNALKFLHLEKYATKATVPNLYFRDYGEALLRVPDYEDQKRISGVLRKIETIIEKKGQETQKLDNLIKARFVEMFGIPGTDPFGYGIRKLGECCELNPKKAQDKRLLSVSEVSFVPMPLVSECGDIDTTNIRPYEEVKKGFTYFAEDDVLFAKITPCMENGKGAIAKGLLNEIGFGSTEFHVLRPIGDLSNPCWIYTLTSFRSFRKDAESNMTGSAGQRRTPVSFLENYAISLPPIKLQDQFASFVAQVDKSKFALLKCIDRLSNPAFRTDLRSVIIS